MTRQQLRVRQYQGHLTVLLSMSMIAVLILGGLLPSVASTQSPENQDPLTQLAETSPEPTTDSETSAVQRFRSIKLKELPPEPALDHEANKTLDMGPFRLSSFIQVASLRPMKLEASYNEPLTLRDALGYALQNNLPIKISRESWNYQRYQLYSALFEALPLPTLSMGYDLTNTHILPSTFSNANVFQTTLRYSVFQGGADVYAFLAQFYRDKGWKQSYYSSINDALLDVYQKYTNLVLQNAILQIRAKSLEVSQAQLQLNNTIYRSGNGTQFAIMQSRTQLASDRQAMLQQQVVVREAALALAFSLNLPMAINLVPREEIIKEASIVNEHLAINDLINIALTQRPELRQYEMFRLAAARNVQVAASPLYPQASFFTSYTHAQTIVEPKNGNLGGAAVAQITPFLNGTGTASNNALGQTASFSPTGSTTAASGANNTIATPIVAASGGTPLNLVQSGSIVTSGAAAPSIAGGNSGATGGTGSASSTSNINGTNTAGAGVFGGLFNTYQAGFALTWTLTNMGLSNIANIVSARTLSRQSLMQANQELLLVTEQVRAAYLSALTAREQIDNAAYGAASAKESLRMANLRLRSGVGTNLELIQAQRDYVTALTTQAQAIISSNLAQAQLLHDIGVISLDTLTDGYKIGQVNNFQKKAKGIK
jgi:outer membrane protein TolC